MQQPAIPDRTDVIVVGAGNAAMCAALAAREAGAEVLVLESASEADRGGNTRYAAGQLRVGFGEALAGHSLRREIVATVVANAVVNRAGISFLSRLSDETGLGLPVLARAHIVARDVFDAAAPVCAPARAPAACPGSSCTPFT